MDTLRVLFQAHTSNLTSPRVHDRVLPEANDRMRRTSLFACNILITRVYEYVHYLVGL